MTTATAIETKMPVFSYAAAASGKAKPSSSGLSTPDESKKSDSVGALDYKKEIPDLSQLNINGESSTASKDHVSTPSEPNGVASGGPASTKGVDSQSSQEDDGRSSISGQEATGSTVDNDDDSKDGKENGPDGKTKFKTHNLIDAPIPKENPWIRRKEAFDRTRALQADTKKPQPPTMNGIASHDKGSQTYGNDRRHNRQKSNVSESRSPHPAASGRREVNGGFDKRAAAEAIKEVKAASPVDDSSRGSGSRPAGRPIKGQQDETVSRDVSTPPAPPSMSDKALWPTPEVAQDEEKREKREKEEREKEKPTTTAARPAKDKWIAMAVTPNIIYDTPLPVRTGRGPRGGRADRGGRVGQPSSRQAADADASTTPTEPTSSPAFDKSRGPQAQPEQRGAQNANSDARSRRPTNASAAQTENSSVESVAKKDSVEAKRDANLQLANGSSKVNGVSSEESSQKDRKPSQPQDDGAFVGQGVLPPSTLRPKTDKPATFQGSRDQNTHSRGGYTGTYGHKQENEANNSTHAPRERPSGRGNFRGGRGDSNSFVNHANSRFNGGNSIRHHSPPSQINTSAHHQSRQSPQYPSSPSTPQTARSYRGNSRSHSVTQSQQYGKYGAQNGAYPPQSPYVQSPSYYAPYYNARNGVNQGVPMHPDYEFTAAVQNVMNQLAYYFSFDNMVKDTYLRSHMDGQGWIFLEVIASFRKVKEMTKDNKNIVREACIQCPEVEFSGFHPDGRERLRPARNPTEWILKYEERDESCRHEGPNWDPARFPHPHMPVTGHQFPGYNPYPQPGHMVPGFVSGQEFVPENGAAYGNGFMPQYQPYMQGHEAPPTNGHPPVDEVVVQTDKLIRHPKKYPTFDEFIDEDINLLVVVLRKNPAEAKSKDGAQQPGVMVTDQLNDALVKLEQDSTSSDVQRSNENEEQLVQFYPTSKIGANSNTRKPSDEFGWFVHPGVSQEAARVPDITTFTLTSYPEFKNRVLSRRQNEGAASVAELDILYRFFSHFLRKHFNLNMYNEFKSLAVEDFHKGYSNGIEYLYKFHVFKIQNFPTPDLFFQDFAIFASDQNHEKPPYDKKMVDTVGYSKHITHSTKTRLARFMQEKNKNFQIWPTVANHINHHNHHHYGGNHNNHNHNHGHQNGGHAANGPTGRA
ncbi:hypothetical protein DRE_02168 [Drechslerella stenobrocha 248]|uniref:HTH La-type RNA-binding domain-containing protein n=1 Tax=Drechslerella stenobrocha 248 TaxID=1043628 RepID=W7HY14_9PEZI|nr:hypothetical protein DRE_02168 [Drechslerella stenobrocha 248]